VGIKNAPSLETVVHVLYTVCTAEGFCVLSIVNGLKADSNNFQHAVSKNQVPYLGYRTFKGTVAPDFLGPFFGLHGRPKKETSTC